MYCIAIASECNSMHILLLHYNFAAVQYRVAKVLIKFYILVY